MDAVMYLKERTRMCGTDWCKRCSKFTQSGRCQLDEEEIKSPNKAVDFVEKWSKKHPRKTYLMDFLEKYPNAMIGDNNIPYTCAKNLGYCKDCIYNCGNCWNTPMEE